jgi:hypothetical protein
MIDYTKERIKCFTKKTYYEMPRKLPKCKLKKTFLKKQIKNVKNNPLKFSRFNPENPEVIRIYKYKIETWERILSRI